MRLPIIYAIQTCSYLITAYRYRSLAFCTRTFYYISLETYNNLDKFYVNLNIPTQQPANMDSYRDTPPPDRYLKGPKLFTLLGSLTLVTFLVCLDTSIMGTVCIACVAGMTILTVLGNTTHYIRVPLASRCRL